ncbi:MAG: mechanosensitive ion channel family protein [Bacteroidota bacterium]
MVQQRIPLLLFFGWLLAFPLRSQTTTPPVPTLESPYNTIYVHLYYLQHDSYQPAIAAKAFYGLADSSRAEQIAIKLKQIYDGKGLYIHLNMLPQQNDYTDSTSQRAFYTPFPEELPEVYLEKKDSLWYYSAETTDRIPDLHKAVYPFGIDWLVNLFPRKGQQVFLGLSLWQYFGILLLLVLLAIFQRILSWLLRGIIRRMAESQFKPEWVDPVGVLKIARALSALILMFLLKLLLPILQLPIEIAEWTIIVVRIVLTLLIVLLALRVLKLVMGYATAYAKSTEHKLDEQLLPILRRALAILFVIGGVIHILTLLNVNVTALVAGISIGGLALALAAQDTVKNLIGSATIFIDHPFQIGDYIEGAGFAGTVQEVGFRTTRVMTADTSIISVPNGTIANMSITNKGMRAYRLVPLDLGVVYNTPPDQIQLFLDALRDLVLAHPNTRKEGFYIYLNKMDASSLTIMFRAYLAVETYDEELHQREVLIMSILHIAELLNISFAFPSTSLYVEQMPAKQAATTPVAPPLSEAEAKERVKNFLDDFKSHHQLPE